MLLLVGVCLSGLDNAGKTTIVKKFNGEDIDIISPTVSEWTIHIPIFVMNGK